MHILVLFHILIVSSVLLAKRVADKKEKVAHVKATHKK